MSFDLIILIRTNFDYHLTNNLYQQSSNFPLSHFQSILYTPNRNLILQHLFPLTLTSSSSFFSSICYQPYLLRQPSQYPCLTLFSQYFQSSSLKTIHRLLCFPLGPKVPLLTHPQILSLSTRTDSYHQHPSYFQIAAFLNRGLPGPASLYQCQICNAHGTLFQAN